MAITAHYAVKDENRHLIVRSRLIAFRAVPVKHTGVNLAGVFYGILKEYGILHKVRGSTAFLSIDLLIPVVDWSNNTRQCIKQRYNDV